MDEGEVKGLGIWRMAAEDEWSWLKPYSYFPALLPILSSL